MNEELLKELYDAYGLSSKGTFDEFKVDMQDAETRKAFFDGYDLSKKGSFQEFETELSPVAPQPTVTTDDSEPTAFDKGAQATGTFNKVLTDVIPDAFKAVGAVTNYGGNLLNRTFGMEDAPVEDNLFYGIGQKIADWKKENIEYSDPRLQDSFVYTDLPAGLGSVAAVLASGGRSFFGKGAGVAAETFGAKEALKQAGRQAASAPTATGGVMMAVPEYDAALEAGASEDEAFGVFLKNYALGMTETIPIENAISFINKTTGGGIMRALKSGAVGSLEEATQEAVQTYTSNLIAQGSYDPERDPLAGVWRSMLAGGIIGGGLAGAGGAVSGRQAQEVNQAIAETTTGDVKIDQQIDADIQDAISIVDQQKAPDVVVSDQQPLVGEQSTTVQSSVADVSPTEETTVEQVFDPQPLVQEALFAKPVLTQERYTDLVTAQEQGKQFKLTPKERQENLTRFLNTKNITDKGQINSFIDEWNRQENRPFGITKADAKSITETIIPTEGKPFDGEKVTVSVQNLIQRLVKGRVKGKTEGVKVGQKFKNDLITNLTETLKASPLSRRQTATILRKIRATNAFTPGSVSKLNQFVRNVVEKADYTQKVGQANALRKNVAKMGRKGSVIEKSVANEFKTIDPTTVDIDTYIEMASKFKGTPPVKEISDYVASVKQTQAAEEQAARTEELSNQLTDFTPEEINSLVAEDVDADQVIEESKAEQARRVLRETARQRQSELVEAPDRTEFGTVSSDKEIFNTIKNFDVNYFQTAQELKEFIKAMDRIAVNNDFGGTKKYEDTQRAIDGYKELGKVSKDFNLIGTLWDPKGAFRKALSSLDVYTDAIFGKIASHSSKFKLYTGWSGISKGQAEAVEVEADLINLLKDLKKRYPKAFKTNKNKFIRGVYNKLITFNADENPEEALALNKELIERDIITYQQEGNSKAELALLKEMYEPFRKAKTMEEVTTIMQKIAPESKIVHDKLVEFYSQFSKEVQDYNYYYYNTKSPDVVNYAGPRRYIKVGDPGAGILGEGFDAKTEVEEITKKFDWVPNALKSTPKQTASSRARSARVTKNERGEILPKINRNTKEFVVMDYNLDGVAENGIRKTINEIRSLPHMMQVRMFANNRRSFFELMGGENENTKKIYNDLFGAGGIYENFEKASLDKLNVNTTPEEKAASRILSWFRNIAYTQALSGPSQLVKQQLVLANTAARLGTSARYLAVNMNKPDVQDFFKGRAINTRESQQSIFNISSYEDNSTLSKRLGDFATSERSQRTKDIMGWVGGLKFLTKSDASAAKRSYLAFYRQNLAKNGVEFQGWAQEKTLENTKARQEAHAYADHMVGLLQTPSNPAEGAQALKTTSVLGSLAKGIFIPYGTFALNQKRRIINDFDTIVKGTSKQRVAAIRDLGATAAEIVGFNVTSWGLRTLYGTALFALFKEMFPGLDDETEEDKKRSVDNFRKQLYTNALLDLIPTVLTQPEPFQPVIPYYFNRGYMTWWNSNAEEPLTQKQFEEEIGMPLTFYAERKSEDPLVSVVESLGMYGAAFDAVGEIKKGFETGLSPEEELTTDQVRLALLITSLEIGAFLGAVPSDVKFAARRINNAQQRNRRNGTYQMIEDLYVE